MCETCNHVVAEIFQVRAAVRPYLKNPSWTNSANKWLPCRKYIEPAKIKDLKLDREDSAQRGKKKRTLVARQKKKKKKKKTQPASQIG